MSEAAKEVEASEENLYKSLSEKGNMWRRKDKGNGDVPKVGYFRDIPASLTLSLYNNYLILNITSNLMELLSFTY